MGGRGGRRGWGWDAWGVQVSFARTLSEAYAYAFSLNSHECIWCGQWCLICDGASALATSPQSDGSWDVLKAPRHTTNMFSGWANIGSRRPKKCPRWPNKTQEAPPRRTVQEPPQEDPNTASEAPQDGRPQDVPIQIFVNPTTWRGSGLDSRLCTHETICCTLYSTFWGDLAGGIRLRLGFAGSRGSGAAGRALNWRFAGRGGRGV